MTTRRKLEVTEGTPSTLIFSTRDDDKMPGTQFESRGIELYCTEARAQLQIEFRKQKLRKRTHIYEHKFHST